MRFSIPKKLIQNLVGTGVLLCFVFGVLRWFEYNQVYHPHRTLEATGATLGRPWEDVVFQAEDGVRLNGWFFPADSGSRRLQYAVLLCHGNAGNISHRLDHCEILLGLGVNVFAFDYRGYGQSAGRPSEVGTYLDAEAACRWLGKKGFASPVIIGYGESLGGAIVAELAIRGLVGGIVLQSTFTSVPDLGKEMFPWLPVRWINTIKYDTLSKLPRIRVPVLVMHSRTDSIVGFNHAQKNLAAANPPKKLFELSGDHNDSLVLDPGQYRRGLDEFLNGIEGRRGRSP